MKVAIAAGLGFALSFGVAGAQPAPDKPGTTEKAGSNEGLGQGSGDRPWATGVSADKQSAALRLFQDGNVALNDGLFPKSVEKYREALKNWDHPAIHYNMALALMNLDHPIEVEDSLKRAIKYGAMPLEKDKFEHAKEYLLLVEKQLATVEISCQKEGARVQVDGKEVFIVKAGAPNTYRARVRIGKHTFYAEKPGYVTGLDAPFIGPGETFRIELKLYTSEELTRYRRRWNATWIPYAVIGGGAAAGLVGGLLTLSAQSSYDEYDAEVKRCNTSSGNNGGCAVTQAGLVDMKESGDTKRTLGFVGYGIAGAAVATGIVLVYLNRQTSFQISSDEYRKEQMVKQRTVSVTPIVVPGMAGALLQGRF